MGKTYKYIYRHSNAGEVTIEFVTDRQVTYQIILISRKPQEDIFILETSLVNTQPTEKQPRDSKIEKTVLKIIKESFKNQPNLNLLFCCDNSDGKGYKRKLLFERWFSNSNLKKIEKYHCTDFSDKIKDAFFILLKDNPNKNYLIDLFESIDLSFKKE